MDLGLRGFFFFLQREYGAVGSSCLHVGFSILVFHFHIFTVLKTKLTFIILSMKYSEVQPKYN